MRAIRLFVTGGTGLVGGAVVAAARDAGGFTVDATFHRSAVPAERTAAATWHRLDATDAAATRALVAAARPDVVLHAAIDARPEALAAGTVGAAEHVAAAAHAAGAAHLHLSSDMVFDGASGPYDEDSPPAPVNDYGRAKAEAEGRVRRAHPAAVLVRLPLIYRLDPLDGALAAWVAAARAGRAHPLFVDEIRCPAHAPDVAAALLLLAAALASGPAGEATLPPPPPIVHLPGPQAISRHAFGVAVLGALGLPAALAVPGRSAEAGTPRPRELVFLPRRTPAVFVAPLRGPDEVLSAAARPTPPGGR
jgi:dTDP-4-dehydrorhamnose reductase